MRGITRTDKGFLYASKSKPGLTPNFAQCPLHRGSKLQLSPTTKPSTQESVPAQKPPPAFAGSRPSLNIQLGQLQGAFLEEPPSPPLSRAFIKSSFSVMRPPSRHKSPQKSIGLDLPPKVEQFTAIKPMYNERTNPKKEAVKLTMNKKSPPNKQSIPFFSSLEPAFLQLFANIELTHY